MPWLVEPSPPFCESRFSAPDDAQEASYFAASANISSFCSVESMFSVLFSLGGEVKRALERRRAFREGTHGPSQSRLRRREGVAALSRHHDVRRADRRGDRGAHRRQGQGAGRQLHRYGGRLCRRQVRGGDRARDRQPAARLGAGDQARQRPRSVAESRRAVAQMGDPVRGGDPCAGSAPTTSTFSTCTKRTTTRRSPRRCARSRRSSATARSAISACRTIARGASPRSAACATRWASTGRS